jgi:hypothetical protein
VRSGQGGSYFTYRSRSSPIRTTYFQLGRWKYSLQYEFAWRYPSADRSASQERPDVTRKSRIGTAKLPHTLYSQGKAPCRKRSLQSVASQCTWAELEPLPHLYVVCNRRPAMQSIPTARFCLEVYQRSQVSSKLVLGSILTIHGRKRSSCLMTLGH